MKSNQDGLGNCNQEIDAALKLLSEAQPPAAMMSRVHRSLETAAAGAHRERLGKLFWMPAIGCAIAAILFVVFTQAHGTQGKQTPLIERTDVAAITPASEGITAARPTLTPARNSARRSPSSQPAIVRRSRREHPQYRHVANLFSYPLTGQEKLLLKFVQTAKPADLQSLNPEYQAKVEAQQEAEFAAYLKSGSSWSYNGTTENTQE